MGGERTAFLGVGQTHYRSTRGEIERLNLPYRIARRPLPEVEIVDMQREPRQRGRPTILSRALRTSPHYSPPPPPCADGGEADSRSARSSWFTPSMILA